MTRSCFKPTDITFNQVAELFLAELRKGNAPSVEVFAQTFPHIADELRDSLPSIAVAESLLAPKTAKEQPLTSLDGFEIKRELGRGAMGIVYEALDKTLARHVAIKVIPLKSPNGSTTVIDRFELERQAMARLEHPNIVPVYSYGHNESYAYLVMKLVQGQSLHELQAGRGDYRLQYLFRELSESWEQLASLGADIAAGLQHAHEQGLVHRDIKPGNLLLDAEGKSWITDFGLAKLCDYSRSLSRTGDIIGTPRYMAPEQLRGVCDARGDVYSLGVTLYELAAGCKVWNDKSELSLITQRSQAVLPNLEGLRKDIPASLAKIIMKACELSPEDRYQSAAELQVVLTRFANGCRPSDRRKKKRLPDEIYRKKAQKHTIVSSLVVTCLAFAGGVVLMNWSSWQPSKSADLTENGVEAVPISHRVSAIGLIDRLADENEADMAEIVSEFLEKSLEESSEDLHFSTAAKEEIQKQIGVVTDKIKTEGLTKENLDDFLESYRKTPLPTATRIMRLSVLVQSSGFSSQEKHAATGTLRRLATHVAHGTISEIEANQIVNGLIGGEVMSTEQLALVKLSDSRLRGWFAGLYDRLSRLPRLDPNAAQQYDSLRGVFEKSFGGGK